MPGAPKLAFDVASALLQGKRESQEDAIVADFPIGAGLGLVVLADGMGGHNAGDIASKIVVTEVYSELKLQSGVLAEEPERIADTLCNAADGANQCLQHYSRNHPETAGMGATLVGLVQQADRLHWISIGDSVLYLLRDGELRQLNQDHSLAPQFDYMVMQGLLSEEDGLNHPDRNCLTSALRGEDIPYVDCPERPLRLRPGDIVLAASDGLPILGRRGIREVLVRHAERGSAAVAAELLRAIERLDDPEQDNVCLSVIRVNRKASAAAKARSQAPRSAQLAPLRPAEAAQVAATGLFARLRGIVGTGTLR